VAHVTPTLRVACVVPTRNRAAFAERSVRSVLDARIDSIRVLVSDNSTDDAERGRLERFCSRPDHPQLEYVRPPKDMAMTPHWNWALARALDDAQVTHVLFLTDRMAFRRDELAQVITAATAYPEHVVTYHQDVVHDEREPIGLQLMPWTGRLLELSTRHLLAISAHGMIHWSLPRMLNCVAPRAVLDRVAQRFGTVFSSISPDFCFAFRCLEIEQSILYLDRAAMLMYGLARSNGASYARGEQTRDRIDFATALGDRSMNADAPVPELHTIRNAIFNEYCFVRNEAASDKFPPIDPRAYLASLVEDMSLLEDRQVRTHMIDVLTDTGWVAAPRRRIRAGAGALKLMFRGWDVVRTSTRAARRVVARQPDSAMWRVLRREPPPGLLRFRSAEEALAYADRVRGPQLGNLSHLPALTTGRDASAREIPLSSQRHETGPRDAASERS
jgi:hypothetical protein